MLRIMTALSGVGLVVVGLGLLDASFRSGYSRYGEEGIIFLAMIAGGICTLLYALKPDATKSDRLITTWMELKRAEMKEKHDKILRSKE